MDGVCLDNPPATPGPRRGQQGARRDSTAPHLIAGLRRPAARWGIPLNWEELHHLGATAGHWPPDLG